MLTLVSVEETEVATGCHIINWRKRSNGQKFALRQMLPMFIEISKVLLRIITGDRGLLDNIWSVKDQLDSLTLCDLFVTKLGEKPI